ncbi:deoxynucleoside triphosphate triphosphohydrolase SAMHD1-like [Chanos chanos]|uniref:Deoxynucleoside triphosphate triphosphohydrolase SAMHD1-like n=1 Tax=Chanos chanos TaxID=29144 RepID=A0A6J2WL02_CHACN|nr:deoxynucleoside triphosphate triphosphohydrolase SAMHD1-like [Chanos chanos]
MSQQKIFNDPIHGYIEMPPLCVEIINTPQFQRLRYIKQLGGGYFVYPGASHNRFEHSIGVCHLAGKLIKMLKEHQPDLGIDDKDALCVQIAGLCHDLGHGPFSHVFEMFMREAGKQWEHEEQSVKMFEALLEEKTKETTETRTIEKLMRDVYSFTHDDFEFIKALIKGKQSPPGPTTNRHTEALVKVYEALIQTIDAEDVRKDTGCGIKLKDLEEIKQLIRNSEPLPRDDTTNQGGGANVSHPTKPEQTEALVKIFQTLMQMRGVQGQMEEHGSTKDTLKRMIELIGTIKPCDNVEKCERQNSEDKAGTRSDKPFLYEIVANKRTGIDVDKMDYLSRDCHHLGMKCNFDHERYMMFARVCDDQICMRDKEAKNMYELFHARHSVHSSAYQHPVKKLVEQMIVDALLEAERAGFQIPGTGKQITEAVEDEKSYLHLTDDVLQEIVQVSLKGSPSKGSQSADSPSKPSDLSEAETLIKRIQTRQLYQCLGTKTFSVFNRKTHKGDLKSNIPGFLKELKKLLKEHAEEDNSKLKSSNFDVLCFSLDYGKKEKDPIDSLGFYKKTKPDKMIHLNREEAAAY